MPSNVQDLYNMALTHKGGDVDLLESLLETAKSPAELAAIPDDRWLSGVSKAIFSAGFNWSVVDKKWLAHEAAFENFEPGVLANWPDERIEELLSDASIIRHSQGRCVEKGSRTSSAHSSFQSRCRQSSSCGGAGNIAHFATCQVVFSGIDFDSPVDNIVRCL